MRPFLAIALASLSVPVVAQPAELEYPEGSLAFSAIVSQDFAAAEEKLRNDGQISHSDPARLINYGYVLAKMGRAAEAARLFRKAAEAKEIELVLADGRMMTSRQAARRALQNVAVGGPEDE